MNSSKRGQSYAVSKVVQIQKSQFDIHLFPQHISIASSRRTLSELRWHLPYYFHSPQPRPTFWMLLKACLGEICLGQIRITWQDVWLHLWQSVKCLLAQAQMVFDNLLRREAEPLSNRNIVVDGCLENLYDRRVSIDITSQSRSKGLTYQHIPDLRLQCFRDNAHW
jgi:hypothetical protein